MTEDKPKKYPVRSKVKADLYAMISATRADMSWSEITQRIEKKYQITNWFIEVRSPLRALLKEGKVRKTRDPFNECYMARVTNKPQNWTGE